MGSNLVQRPIVFLPHQRPRRKRMNAIIYLVGLVVIVMAILSFIGMR
jgi:predicted nucleic acid-binding Zn ribbon protein